MNMEKENLLMEKEKYTTQDKCARNKNPTNNHHAAGIKKQVFIIVKN